MHVEQLGDPITVACLRSHIHVEDLWRATRDHIGKRDWILSDTRVDRVTIIYALHYSRRGGVEIHRNKSHRHGVTDRRVGCMYPWQGGPAFKNPYLKIR